MQSCTNYQPVLTVTVVISLSIDLVHMHIKVLLIRKIGDQYWFMKRTPRVLFNNERAVNSGVICFKLGYV